MEFITDEILGQGRFHFNSAYQHGLKHYNEGDPRRLYDLIEEHWRYLKALLSTHGVPSDELPFIYGCYAAGFTSGWEFGQANCPRVKDADKTDKECSRDKAGK